MHKILHDMEEYSTTCPRMKFFKKHYKKDEKIKWMKKDEQNMFTTKSYVLIQTLPLHNQEVCVN
jgi:hypothetical protein